MAVTFRLVETNEIYTHTVETIKEVVMDLKGFAIGL